MKPVFIHDKTELENFLLERRTINYYALGDLDDFFWPYTTWLALKEGGEIQALVLLYNGGTLPTVLAFGEDNRAEMLALVEGIRPLLPQHFYSHFTPGLDAPLRDHFSFHSGGEHYQMALAHPECLADVDVSEVENLTTAHLAELLDFYAASYPGNWFDPRMLETGQYFGMRDAQGQIISVAGIHVYSPEYKIAALGNITTLPSQRGKGLGTKTVARLCRSLLETVDVIGLNVKADNAAALHVYEKLGFEIVAPYYEYTADACVAGAGQ